MYYTHTSKRFKIQCTAIHNDKAYDIIVHAEYSRTSQQSLRGKAANCAVDHGSARCKVAAKSNFKTPRVVWVGDKPMELSSPSFKVLYCLAGPGKPWKTCKREDSKYQVSPSVIQLFKFALIFQNHRFLAMT